MTTTTDRTSPTDQDSPTTNVPERVTLPCVHCGEPTVCVADQAPDDVFCCQGCVGAYHLIHGLGLDAYYEIREQSGARPADASGGDSHFSQFDEPEFLGPSAPVPVDEQTQQSTLSLQGLHCGACSWLIERALSQTPGVKDARVRMHDHRITIAYHPAEIALSSLARLISRLGYGISPICDDNSRGRQLEERVHLTRIAVAGFLAANSMWIAIALYAGAGAGYGYYLGLVGGLLGLVAVVGPGRIFFTGALAAIQTRTPHMDLPIALGLSAGGSVGTIHAITGQGHLYFDSVTALVFLLSIGRWLQFRQQRRAAEAVELMMRLTPQHAHRVDAEGKSQRVLVQYLKEGDIVEVRSGECIPADGWLREPQNEPAILDCSLLTGESRPVELMPGDSLSAGVINQGPPIRIAVSAVGKATRIGQVMESVEDALSRRTPMVMLADRIGGYFVIAVILLALLAVILWMPYGIDIAINHATALLIVACPCALALATPLAIAVGLGRAAQQGILIRDGAVFQRLSRPGQIWMDKTGTLTEGKLRVTSLEGDADCLALACSLEQECEHPVSRALLEEARLRGIGPASAARDIQRSSNGISGIVDGRRVAVGSAAFFQHLEWRFPNLLVEARDAMLGRGESPTLVGIDGVVTTVLGLSDPIRESMHQVVQDLSKRGWQVGILSGDHVAIVQRVGKALGIDSTHCFGEQTPQDKLRFVETARESGDTVVMVGDGANDAAALAAADVGIAVRGGAEASLRAAPTFLSKGSTALPSLVVAANRVQKMIIATFAVSLGYNLIAVGLALSGNITPLIAAILMPISSFSVLLMTLTNPTFGGKSS